MQLQLDQYKDLKLQLDGFLRPGEQHRRNVLLDSVYASLPRDPQAKVLVFSAEIVPGGYTNWRCHNGATFFVCTYACSLRRHCTTSRRFTRPHDRC